MEHSAGLDFTSRALCERHYFQNYGRIRRWCKWISSGSGTPATSTAESEAAILSHIYFHFGVIFKLKAKLSLALNAQPDSLPSRFNYQFALDPATLPEQRQFTNLISFHIPPSLFPHCVCKYFPPK